MQYRLALGLALVKDNHPAEASVYLNALLKRDPENALANLGQARIAVAQGKTADAVKFFRRAIDGVWPAGQEQSRMQTRFELAALLEKGGQRMQAVAELLAALGSTGRDASVKKKIGQLLLSYDAPREAADVFRNVAQTDDRDAEASADLGAAELAMENYQEARDAFQKAVERNPSDEASKKQFELTERVLALDPNARGLRAAARYQRSKELLEAAIMRFDQCQAGSKTTGGADPSASARQAVASHPRRDALEDAADMDLALAKGLWKQGEKVCGAGLNSARHAPNPDDGAIERVLGRLTKQ
jgi:tetratricopeptide (TPR) repeat protein